jgi:hypothetical protein
MKNIFFLAFAALTLASCEDLLFPDTETKPVDSSYTEPQKKDGITLTNTMNESGTYTIIGPHSFCLQTNEFLKTPQPGEYEAFWVNQKVNNNTFAIDGKQPIFLGYTTFVVTSPIQTATISVPVREITCYFQFQSEKGVKISSVLLKGTEKSVYIDGVFVHDEPTVKLDANFDSYVIASKIDISATIELVDDFGASKDVKLLKKAIDAKPGKKYTMKVGENGISITSE